MNLEAFDFDSELKDIAETIAHQAACMVADEDCYDLAEAVAEILAYEYNVTPAERDIITGLVAASGNYTT